MMRRNTGLVAASLTLIMSCGPAQEADEGAVPAEPVVVYATYEDRTYLPALVDAYTKETGVVVIVRHGDTANIVDDVIGNRVSPPADLLWTSSVSGIWRSAEEGALRPLHLQHIDEDVPAWLRDPDDFWVGISYRTAVLVYDSSVISEADLSDYASLAEPRYRGRLCLSSSVNSVNRSVIAMLIDALDVRPAEIVVRGWMANLAMPVFDSEATLLDAIQSGSCGIGIASSTQAAATIAANAPVSVHVPATAYTDVEGVGVARHARNPHGAVGLVEWLLTTATQTRHAKKTLSYPVNENAALADVLDAAGRDNSGSRNVVLVAWHEYEAIKLAERATYR